MNISDKKIVDEVVNWPGGCRDEKEKFLKSLDLKWPTKEVEYEVTYRIKGTLKGDKISMPRELWRRLQDNYMTERLLKRWADYSDGIENVTITYVSDKQIG